MLYCINPRCEKRENPDMAKACQFCKTPLLIHDRYHIIGFLCERHCAATELFYVTDIQKPLTALVLKTLISKDPKVRLLFEQEQLLSDKLIHPSISKGYDSFAVLLENRQEILCLVIDHIPGKNLEQWVIDNGSIGQDQAVKWLKQLLKSIRYLHDQQIIHRDIKPSNIICKPDRDLVLIDFGSAKRITKEIISNTAVGSVGFTAPEQFSGKAVTQSDFYALGKTLMYLLMGSDFNNQNTFVPNQAISPVLHKLLQEMTMHKFQDRPTNTKKILRRLRKVEQAPVQKQRLQTSLIFGAGVICGGMIISWLSPYLWKIEPEKELIVCDRVIQDNISCGEESFFSTKDLKNILGANDTQKEKISRMADFKEKGMKYITQGDWSKARKPLEQVWNETQDPEALIYLNNSKIESEKKIDYTIAVAAGLNRENAKGLNLLRGVAYAQTKAIASGISLRVVLVDDQDKSDIAKSMAEKLIKHKEIIAVIEHHVSDVTEKALEIYNVASDKMVIISPTSTSEKLDKFTKATNHIFFRTVASDQATASSMANFLFDTRKIYKVAIFYDDKNSYSKSLQHQFRIEFMKKKNSKDIEGNIIQLPEQFYLSCKNCERLKIDEAIKYAKSQGAKAFIVIPNANENAKEGQSWSMEDAINIVKRSKEVEIVTGDSMAGIVGLLTKEAVDRVTIISPREKMEPDFIRFWQPKLKPQQQISWYAHTSYNATQVLITAMQQNKNKNKKLNRDTLREWISAPGFSTSDKVQFSEDTGELNNENSPPTLTRILECNGKPVFLGLKSECPKF
jgi:eukaryotic-like serine/threonine-protein kinase